MNIGQESGSGTKPEAEVSSQNVNSVKKDTSSSICMIVMGMAGSGKTTFVQKLSEHMYEQEKPGYLVNLDPACYDMPYPANVDIRDSVNYKKVMKEYELGPNGAIITSLNLFSTKFHQFTTLIEERVGEFNHFVIDTPGQIEVFNWSASGMIITESLSSLMPTVIVYIIDTVRNKSPSTFMANMLYALSLLYKTKLPLILVMNKTDLQSSDFILDWMKDFENFEAALEADKDYISGLTRSLSLVLDTFYSDLKTVSVSSVSGIGLDNFLELADQARKEYLDIYLKERSMMRDSVVANLAEKKLNINVDEAIPEESEEEDEELVEDGIVRV